MKYSNLFLGLVLPSGGWQSLIPINVILLNVILQNAILLNINWLVNFAKYLCTDCHSAECSQGECHSAGCSFAPCHSAECYFASCHLVYSILVNVILSYVILPSVAAPSTSKNAKKVVHPKRLPISVIFVVPRNQFNHSQLFFVSKLNSFQLLTVMLWCSHKERNFNKLLWCYFIKKKWHKPTQAVTA